MKVVIEDDIANSFKILKSIAYEVGMEQMSKAGSKVQKNIRTSLSSTVTRSRTRVSKNGKAYLQSSSPRPFGLRESHTIDNQSSSPNSMGFAITSFVMEKSGTLVVAGLNKGFRPLIRRDGKVIGVGKKVGAIGGRTMAVIHRMDTGEENSEYDKNSQLSRKKFKGRNFISKGIANSQSAIKGYLEAGYVTIMGRAVNKADIKRVIKNYG